MGLMCSPARLLPRLPAGGSVFPGSPPSVGLFVPGWLTLIVRGDRLRHISTQLDAAAKTHYWLHWELCLVTKATRRRRRRRGGEEGGGWDGAAGSASQGSSFSNATFLSRGHVCHCLSLSVCPHTQARSHSPPHLLSAYPQCISSSSAR